jgi:hypothetical protein
MIGAAVHDPNLHFAAIICCTAKGLFDHVVGDRAAHRCQALVAKAEQLQKAAAEALRSTRAVNAMHDGFLPLSGGILLANMMVDEVIVRAPGSGLFGMRLFCVVTGSRPRQPACSTEEQSRLMEWGPSCIGYFAADVGYEPLAGTLFMGHLYIRQN